MTLIEYPNMPNVGYTYNNLGQVATMTDGIGTTTYGYDTMGRLTSVDGPWANDTITYSYDALGRRSAISVDGDTTNYDYDNLSRLSEVSNGSNVFGYSYNGASDQLNAVTLPNGTESTFSYDSLGRLSNVHDKVSGSSANISNFTYGYDNRDVQTSVQRALGTGATQTINYTSDTPKGKSGGLVFCSCCRPVLATPAPVDQYYLSSCRLWNVTEYWNRRCITVVVG